MNPRIFIGPMSLNVVDAAIACANEKKCPLGLIPSRRQIDYMGGYVGTWDTSALSMYVKDKTNLITLERDHGGPMQGQNDDLGYDSFKIDSEWLDIVHIDPWKTVSTVEDGIALTIEYLKFCHSQNPELKYEVGTEEAIFRYEAEDLDYLLTTIKKEVPEVIDKVVYAVIQSGTHIQCIENIGVYCQDRLKAMTQICHQHGVQSKEHNGDYLTPDEVNNRFQHGLNAINIAPEFGVTETRVILNHIEKTYYDYENDIFVEFFKICFNSGKWRKWYPVNVDFGHFTKRPEMKKLIEVCGHYQFSDNGFLNKVWKPLIKKSPSLQEDIQKVLRTKINQLINLC